MMGKRRRTGYARAAISVAIALALLGPGLAVPSSPGGDSSSRSTPTPPTLLMVNVNETTCLVEAVGGGVFAGTSGGGIARWTDDGILFSVQTTADPGLLSNHIVDLAKGTGSCYAIARTDEPMIYATGSNGNSWFSLGPVTGANGPLTTLRGHGDRFVVLDDQGSVFISDNAVAWERPDLPAGIPDDGWTIADLDGDVLALSNGSDVVIVDLDTGGNTTITTPPINALDLDGDQMAVAFEDFADYYNLTTSSWMENIITRNIGQLGDGWAHVKIDNNRLMAVTLDGVVIEVDIEFPVGVGDIVYQGSLPDDLEADVTDMVLLANDTLLLSTMKGNWVIRDGDASPFLTSDLSMPPTNDIRSVGFEADVLWALTPYGLSFLDFDTRGLPTGWAEGPDLGEGAALGTLDTAYLEGTVYICGYGPGIHTYDTFASSAASRWDRTHLYGDARDTVNDVAVVNGVLYSGGPYGIDRMVPGTDPPEFEMVTGAPAGVLSLLPMGDTLYVGTENGLWRYIPNGSHWAEPEDVVQGFPKDPMTDISTVGYHFYVAVNETIMRGFTFVGPSIDYLSLGSVVTRLASRPSVDDPVWGVADGRAFTVHAGYMSLPGGGSSTYLYDLEPGRDAMGDAQANDLSIAPDGTVFLATDSGLHRIGRYGTSWSEWTTSNGLSANDIRSLSYVESGDLWIGAYGGVDILDVPTGDTTRIGVEDGIPSNLVYDIKMEKQDVWIGTDVGGAARANRNSLKWSEYNMSTGLIADDVQALAIWNDHVLFGTDEGVTVLDRGRSTIESYTSTSSDLPGNWIWCTLSHHTGIYVGTDLGLARFEPDTGTWTAYPTEGIDGGPVRSLEMTITGQLWVGTNEGVYILLKDPDGVPNETKSQFLDRSNGLPGDEVLALKEDSAGMMWVGTSAGVAIVEGGRGFPGSRLGVQATFTTHDGLVHDRVTAIEEGPEGTMWLGTAGGLSRLTKVSWDLQPQWAETYEDIPDVYLALDNIAVDPEEPNEGDLVNITVTVSNPSGKRAIVHVGLFEVDFIPGTEISTDIAYTEPGGSYDVTLTWTAIGGEQNLWIVADPDNVVPESNERNNVVALTLHVNHLPEILDLNASKPQGKEEYPDQMAYVQVSFVFRDPDGDGMTSAVASVVDMEGSEDLIDIGGNPTDGIEVGGTIIVPLGSSTIVVEVSDGRSTVKASLDMNINFAIDVTGLETGRDPDGRMRFSVTARDPWEGEEIVGVSILLVEQGTDPTDPAEWQLSLFGSASRDGDGWAYLAARDDPGTYDVWVLAMDERLIEAFYVEEAVQLDDPTTEEDVPWYVWAFGAVIIVSIVSVIIYSKKGRSRT